MTVGGGGGQFDPKWCHFSLASIPSASLLPVATCHTTFVTISQFPTKQVCNLSHSPSPYNITIFQNLNAWTFRDWHLSGGQSAQPLLLPKLHCCLPGPPALHRGYQGRALRYWIIFFIMSDYPALIGRKDVCEVCYSIYLSTSIYTDFSFSGYIPNVAHITYVNSLDDTSTRQEQLSTTWHFLCDCSLCANKK